MIDQTINELDELHLNLAQNNISKAAAADWLENIIARLRAQRAAGNEQWISLDSTLPPAGEGNEVLVSGFTGYVGIENAALVVTLWKQAKVNGERSFYTHWRPKPSPAAPTQPTTEQEGKGL